MVYCDQRFRSPVKKFAKYRSHWWPRNHYAHSAIHYFYYIYIYIYINHFIRKPLNFLSAVWSHCQMCGRISYGAQPVGPAAADGFHFLFPLHAVWFRFSPLGALDEGVPLHWCWGGGCGLSVTASFWTKRCRYRQISSQWCSHIESPTLLAHYEGIHRSLVVSPHKELVMGSFFVASCLTNNVIIGDWIIHLYRRC